MKSVRTIAAVAAGLLVLALVAGSPASAGEPPPTGTITVEPTSGHPGTEFLFTGEGCVSDTGPGVVELAVFFGEELIAQPDPAFVIVQDDGSWQLGFVANVFATEAEAVGLWDVTGTCFDAETDKVLVDYDVTTFEVTARPTPPTEPPPPPPPTEEPAPPAAPVPAEPSFTG